MLVNARIWTRISDSVLTHYVSAGDVPASAHAVTEHSHNCITIVLVINKKFKM